LAEFQTEVYSDGTRLFGNDYVRSTPDLLIKLTGKSLEQLISSDTTIFRIMLNNRFVSLFGSSKPSSNAAITKDIDKGNMFVRFTPQLKNGLNYLNLITNKGGGNFDTMKYILNVTSEISLKDVFNYPNPMKDNTTFTFTVTGSEQPGEGKIKIFSVAGRVIKTINVNLSIGYNRVYWDGKDADGDYIANGVYLYKLIIEGNNQKETALQKLVVLK
jgi:hypothetical protein